jgi:hypothetical protein
MNSNLTKLAAAAGPRVQVQSYRYDERAARFAAFEVEFTEGDEQRG